MPSAPPPPSVVTRLHGVWVTIFLFEGVFRSGDLGRQLGALFLGLLFSALIVAEARSSRSRDLDESVRLEATPGPGGSAPTLPAPDRPRPQPQGPAGTT